MNSALRSERLMVDSIGVVLCMVLLAGSYFLCLGPVLRHKDDAAAGQRLLAVQRQKAAAAQGNVVQLKRQMAELQTIEGGDVLQSAREIRANERLQEITSLAAERGLLIKGVEPGHSREEPHYRATPLRLSGTGSYRGCIQFLHDLRGALRDTTVVGFSLSGTPETVGAPVTFDLDLCWYAAPAVASAQNE